MKLGTKIKKLLAVSLACFTMLGAGGMVVSADIQKPENSYEELQAAVVAGKAGTADVASHTYVREEGGEVAYSEVVDQNTGLVNETEFAKLTSKSKQQLLTDMKSVADAKVVADSPKGANDKKVTEGTVTNWMNALQNCNGVGTQLMNALLQNTKPDYATANRIYEPFSGVVGTALGLIAIVLMAALALTMGLDLSYIGIPAFRLFLDGEDAGKGKKPKIISYEAVNAVQVAENGGGGNGSGDGNKVAVGIYFKKRVVMLIILGICLLYLVSGNIFTFVSWILDLVSGFLGF